MGSIRRQLGYVSAYPVVISTPEQTATLIDFLVVGGGAGGWRGSSGVYGSGGWGGRVVKSSADGGTLGVGLTLNQNYIVSVGAGGAENSEGNLSYFNYVNSSVKAQSNGGVPNISGTGASLTSQAGISSSITGTSVGYGGGGGGANPAVAGVDGGGAGTGNGVAGTANRGGGGGGNGSGGVDAAGVGGSGVVIIRVLTSLGTITIGAGLTGSTATVGDYKVTTITAGTGNVSWA